MSEANAVRVELGPCPFCGGEATTVKIDARPCQVEGWQDAYWAGCKESVRCSGRLPKLHKTEAEAVAAWNQRAPSPTLDSGRVEAVARAIRDVKTGVNFDYMDFCREAARAALTSMEGEREKIVAFMRAQAELGTDRAIKAESATARAAYGGGSLALVKAADAISRGDHMGEEG